MTTYELKPSHEQNQKSFYGKARVQIDNKGTAFLYSYNTLILSKDINGNYIRYWDGWSQTTGKHIKAFSGLNKKEYENIKMEG